MRKTISNGINRRAVYKFDCKSCGKHKSTYVYDRAKKAECATCERNKPDPNQPTLFENPHPQVLNPISTREDGKNIVSYEMTIGEVTITNPEAANRLQKYADEASELRAKAIKATVADMGELNQVNNTLKERGI